MFQTFDAHRKFSPFAKPGEYGWDLVSFVLNEPWFHVTFNVITDENHPFQRSIMLLNLHQLILFSERDDLRFENVDVVSPGYVNGSTRWRMDPLREIWLQKLDRDDDDIHYENVFHLESGEKLVCFTGPPEDLNCKSKLIFSWKN